jgi:hypothetical protein
MYGVRSVARTRYMGNFFEFKSSYKCIIAYRMWSGACGVCLWSYIGVLFSGFTRAFLLYALFWGALVYFDKLEEDKRSRESTNRTGEPQSCQQSTASLLSSRLSYPSRACIKSRSVKPTRRLHCKRCYY